MLEIVFSPVSRGLSQKPAKARPEPLDQAWPDNFVGRSPWKPGLSSGFQAELEPEHHYRLGIWEKCCILLSQCSYIDSILRCYGLDNLKPVSIPMDPNVCPTSAQSSSTTENFACMQNIPYYKAVGSLMYASLSTHPDITYTVQTVSHFSTNSRIEYWEAVKRIFHYLKGTKDLWLSYREQQRELSRYADTDESMPEDRRAVQSMCFWFMVELFCGVLNVRRLSPVMYCANTDHKTSHLARLFPRCLWITLGRQLRDLSSQKNHLTHQNNPYNLAEPQEYW